MVTLLAKSSFDKPASSYELALTMTHPNTIPIKTCLKFIMLFRILITISILPSFLTASTKYIKKIPDFTQTHITDKQLGGGEQLCGPVAVSNSLIWLNENKGDQPSLIRKLASKEYMNTNIKSGTGTTSLLRGIKKYASETFGGYKELSYQGWRDHLQESGNGETVPNMTWIQKGISNRSTVWLNIGWYKYLKKEKEYNRVGGHWVTLVGYRGSSLILHDPSPRAGEKFSNQTVKPKKISTGTLTGSKKGLPMSAKGFYILQKGMYVKSSADLGIIDGAVRLILN